MRYATTILLLAATAPSWSDPADDGMRRVLRERADHLRERNHPDPQRMLGAPMHARPSGFLYPMLAIPPVESAILPTHGELRMGLETTFSRARHGHETDRFRHDQKTVYTDATMRIDYAPFHGLDLVLEVPVGKWSGDLGLWRDGNSVFRERNVGFGRGDPRTGIRLRAFESPSRTFTAALAGTVSPGSGSGNDYLSNRETDLHGGILVTFDPGPYALHANVGYADPGNLDSVTPELRTASFGTWGGAGVVRLSAHWAAIAQIQGHEDAFDEPTADDAFRDDPKHVLAGLRFRIDDHTVIEGGGGRGIGESAASTVLYLAVRATF